MKDSRMNKHNMKKAKKKRRAIKIISLILFLIIASVGGFYYYVRQKIKVAGPPKNDNVASEKKSDYHEQEGINNILLIGVDSRNPKEHPRSDSMIIMTIDDNNKKLKLTSIMRDSYVPIEGHKPQKINAAYAFGGPELLLKTLRQNFKINIDKYVIIDFKGFESLINSVDGIEVDVKDYEIKELNKFMGEATGGRTSPLITKTGVQKLDGQQALSYARIRKVGDGVYERDTRQRRVISLLAEKLKDISIMKYPEILNAVLPMVKTNIEPLMLLNYGYTVSNFKPLTVEQLQIPQNELSDGRIYNASWVQLMDIEQNAKVLNDFVFNNKTPNPKEFDISQFKSVLNDYLSKETISRSTNSQNNNSQNSNKQESQEEHSKNTHQTSTHQRSTQQRSTNQRSTQQSNTQKNSNHQNNHQTSETKHETTHENNEPKQESSQENKSQDGNSEQGQQDKTGEAEQKSN